MGRLKDPNVIPLGVALQALVLFLAAFFLTPGTAPDPNVTGVGGDGTGSPEAVSSLSELPRDLRREFLPVPRVPERENPDPPPQPTPKEDASDSLISEGPKLASLRTEAVSLAGPVAIPISAPLLGAPDSLDGLSLAGGGWLGGGRSASGRRGTRSGGPTDIGDGGQGVGGFGGGSGGSGGYCPTPGRVGRGGGGRPGGGGVVSGGSGRPAGGGDGATTGTPSGGPRERPAGGKAGGATRKK